MIIDLDHISFAEWLIELNREAKKAGFFGEQELTEVTGQVCWYEYYAKGATPGRAIEEMAQDGVLFGCNYTMCT